MPEFKLPDPGEGLVEATIIEWKVAVGDTVQTNDIVVEVETAKSLVELPIPWAGTVAAILVAEGDTVDVGTPIIRIDDGSDEPEDSGRTPNLVGYGPTEGATKRRARRGVPEPNDASVGAASGSAPVTAPTPAPSRLPRPGQPAPQPHPAQIAANKVLAKPPLRKFAKDHDVDLREVTGTGTGGVITRADVEAHLAKRQRGSEAGGFGGAGVSGLVARREPIRGVRKATAAAMVACLSRSAAAEADRLARQDAGFRSDLVRRLSDVGLPTVPGSAPFVLVDTSPISPESLRAPLATRGFAVRRAETFPGLGPTWLRLAVRTPKQHRLLAEALGQIKEEL